MQHHQSPVAVRLTEYAEIIDFILKQNNVATTMIICATRASFLADIQAEVQRIEPTPLLNSPGQGDSGLPHSFLSPVLQVLATSRMIHLAFAPTLPHLRAYLAVFSTTKNGKAASLHCHQSTSRRSMLVILDLVAIHRSTSEYSAQGLSRTLAIAVEAARLGGMNLALAEHYKGDNDDSSSGINDAARRAVNDAQQGPWKEQVPILSGSIRFGNDEGLWAGKTIDVGKVLGRWCGFVTLDKMIPVE
jgi:hypothetical protein